MTLSSIFGGTKGQHLQDGRQRTCEDFFGLWESFLAQLAFGAVWITVSVRVKYARRGCCGLCKIVSDYVKLCFVLVKLRWLRIFEDFVPVLPAWTSAFVGEKCNQLLRFVKSQSIAWVRVFIMLAAWAPVNSSRDATKLLCSSPEWAGESCVLCSIAWWFSISRASAARSDLGVVAYH